MNVFYSLHDEFRLPGPLYLMNRYKSLRLLWWLLLWLPALVRADMVALDPLIQGVPLGHYLEYQIDTDGKATLEQMQTRPDWQPVTDEVPNMGLAAPVHWFRLEIQVVDPSQPWLVEVGYNQLDRVDLFLLGENGQLLDRFTVGMLSPVPDARAPHLGLVAPLRVQQPGLVSLYARVESSRALQFPLLLWQRTDFIVHDEMQNLLLGLFFGMLAVLLLYNFFLFTVLRNRLYLMFTLFMFTMIMFHCQERGISLRFFWPGQWGLNASVWLVSGMLTIFLGVLIADHFMQLEQRAFPLLKLIRLVRWLALLAALISPWLGTELGVAGMVLLALLATTLLLVAVFYYYQTDNRPVQFFALGWVILLGGVLILTGNRVGLLPVNVFSEHAVSVATLLQFMLFSMALSHRMNHEKNQQLQRGGARLAALQDESNRLSQQLRTLEMQRTADTMALQLQTTDNDRLTHEVEDRALALEQVSQRLRELSRLDPLTGLYNRNHCNERLREEFERGARASQPVSLLLLVVDQYGQVCERWGSRAGDQMLQQVAEILQSVTRHACASLFQFEDQVFAVLLPGQPAERAQSQGEMIRAAVAQQPFLQAGNIQPMTASVGVGALIPVPGGRPENWVRLAQQALNRARRQGGDTLCVEEFAQGVARG